jgi:hypothetical protein
MGRIRTIKPEFFKHSGLFDAEQETGLPLRIGFAGLWTCSDREGRFKWRPRELKLDVLPYDDCDFSCVLDALATRGFIVKYASESEAFGYIPSWKSHQFVNPKEAQSHLPNPCDGQQIDASITRGERVEDANETRGVKEGKGTEGSREGKGIACLPTDRPKPSGITIDPHMVARGLCERLGLSRQMGQGSVYMAVCDIAQIEEVRGGDLEHLCDRMAEAHQTWMREELTYRWGAAKFFGEGWWDKPDTWPRKNENSLPDKAARREKKWEEFEAKENDNAIQ